MHSLSLACPRRPPPPAPRRTCQGSRPDESTHRSGAKCWPRLRRPHGCKSTASAAPAASCRAHPRAARTGSRPCRAATCSAQSVQHKLARAPSSMAHCTASAPSVARHRVQAHPHTASWHKPLRGSPRQPHPALVVRLQRHYLPFFVLGRLHWLWQSSAGSAPFTLPLPPLPPFRLFPRLVVAQW